MKGYLNQFIRRAPWILIFCLLFIGLASISAYRANVYAGEDEDQQQDPPADPTNPDGGGGHEMYTGDMFLTIGKWISLDNSNFYSAGSQEAAFHFPEKETHTVYVRIAVRNDGVVSATHVIFDHSFDSGDSDMVAEPITLVSPNVNYNPTTDTISIDKILVGETVSFTYQFVIHELGQSDEKATDTVNLNNYGSNLPITQDALNYLGIGLNTTNYLVANNLPNPPTGAAGALNGGGGNSLGGVTPPMLPATGNTASMWLMILVSYFIYRSSRELKYRYVKNAALKDL